MIRIQLKQIDYKGIKFEGEEPSSFLDFQDNEFLKGEKPVGFDLLVTLVNGGVLVNGRVWTTIEATCGRCLEKYEFNMVNSEICHFYENIKEPVLDITNDIREDILICIPQKFLCSEECKGLCHICGKNLNIKKCRCKEPPVVNDVWSDLDKLKLKK